MVCFGFKPGATDWKAQTKLQSYGGHILLSFLSIMIGYAKILINEKVAAVGLYNKNKLLGRMQCYLF